MAKIPTGRIILYVILGVAVIVLGVWIIRTRQQESKLGKRVVEVEDIPKDVARWTREIDKLTPYISRLSGENAARGQEILQKVRTDIEEFQKLTDPDELTQKRDEIVDYIAELRRLKRIAIKGE
ncbi:MAG: hypothetical protein ABIK47_04850 [candidate division WOR-3 bacterium]